MSYGPINRDQIKRVIFYFDPTDKECDEVAIKLERAGIPFEKRELGQKDRGYGINLTVASQQVDPGTTRFGVHLRPPILVVDYSWKEEGDSRDIMVLAGRAVIYTALGIG